MTWFVVISAHGRARRACIACTASPCHSSSATCSANQAPVSTKTRRGPSLAPALLPRRTREDPIVGPRPTPRACPARLPDQPEQGLVLLGLDPEEQGHGTAHQTRLRLAARAGEPLERS